MKTSVCVSIPVETKEKALVHRLSFSGILNEALLARIKDLERAGGKPEPAPGHPDELTTEADPC